MDFNVSCLLTGNANFTDDEAVEMVLTYRTIVNTLFTTKKEGRKVLYIPRQIPEQTKVDLERKRDKIFKKFYSRLIGTIYNVASGFENLDPADVMSISLTKLNDCLLTWNWNYMGLEAYTASILKNALITENDALFTAKNEVWQNLESIHCKEESVDETNNFDENFYDVGAFSNEQKIFELMSELESNPKLTKVELIIIETILRTGAKDLTEIAKNLIIEYEDTIKKWFHMDNLVESVMDNTIINNPLYKDMKNGIWKNLDNICYKLEGTRFQEMHELKKIQETRIALKRQAAKNAENTLFTEKELVGMV